MEYESWSKERLIEEIKPAMVQAIFIDKHNSLTRPAAYAYYSSEELAKKNIFQLRSIYVEFKKSDKEFLQKYEDYQEKKRFFNQPECDADFNYWARQAYWSIDEAIALILGKDPRKVSWDNVKPYLTVSAFANKFNDDRELARRYVYCKELFDPVFPGIFLAWAARMSMSIPGKLKDAISAIGIQVADWKGNYEQTIEQYNQLNKLYAQAAEVIKIKEEIIEVLNLQLSVLEAKQEQPNRDNLKETERQSLYKLIAAMAYDGYGYNPNDKKSLKPKEISDAVTEHLGENIDSDTARKWLKRATDKYPKAREKTG